MLPHAAQALDVQPDRCTHPPDLAVFSLVDGDGQLRCFLPLSQQTHPRGRDRLPVDGAHRGKLTSIQRIKASEGELSGSDLVTNVLQRDMEKIRMAMDQTDGSEFSHVVDIIAQAKHIYIVGFRSSSFLAGYLNFYFRLIYDNVTQVQGGAAGTFDQLFRVGPGDVVIAICFPRYSELALKTVQYAKDRGATIIGVTDSEMSPVYQMSSGSLLVRNEMISFVDSLAAPMSMLNALILAAAHKQGTDISATFNELEHVWDRFGIFGKVEDE